MAGYTPLFSSLTTGTLCGRWQDIGLWPIVLSMADKDGVVDVTPVPEAGWRIMPTRWDRGSVLNNYGAALQFAKPAGTK